VELDQVFPKISPTMEVGPAAGMEGGLEAGWWVHPGLAAGRAAGWWDQEGAGEGAADGWEAEGLPRSG
jgi:hypothetical protein